MCNISAIILRLCGSLVLITRVEAEVSFQYDLPGNLASQSNNVSIGLPQFQQAGPQFIGVTSNGLVAISVPVVGVGPFTFQWLLNTAPVAGAANDSYVIANATTANLGNYQLVAANTAGAVTSSVVNVSFLDPSGSGLPLAWEMYYFGTNGLIGFSDPDNSGATLYQDYTENINPTNAGSASAINPGSPAWINPKGGNWSVGTNWSTGSAPAIYSSPVITLAGTYTVTVDVPVNVVNLSVGANGSSPTLYIPAGQTVTVFGNAEFNGQASLNLGNTTLTVGSQLSLAGGANTFSNGTVAGTLTWTGGSLAGSLTVASKSVFNMNCGGGNGFLYGLVLTNYGTVNWTNTPLYGRMNQNAQIYNYGLWNAQSDNTFVGGNDGGTSLFDNFGTFLKSGNAGTTILDGNIVFNNTGTVTVESGTLAIKGGGTGTGSTFATTGNGNISIYGYVYTNTTTFTGAGNYVAGGTATFGGAIVGTLNWEGGNLNGVMTLTSNSVFNINFGDGNGFFYGLVLTNYGTVNWTNTQLYGRNDQNAQIYNYGLWNAQSDNTFTGGNDQGTSLFDNFGTFVKSGNAGTTMLDGNVVFNNTGTVGVQSGTLRIDTGSNNGGDFATTNNATLNLSSYVFTNTTTFTGSGSYVAGGATFAGKIMGMLNWDGGNLNGVMTLASNSVFNINFGDGNAFFYGLVMTNYGTVNWTNTQLYGANNQNAQIYNYGLWNAQSDNTFGGGNLGGTSLFDNFGTFVKLGNAGSTVLDGNVVFNNTGTVSVQSGTLSINGGGVNSGNGTFITGNGGLLVLDNLTFANSATISSSTPVDLGGNTTMNGVLTAANVQLVSGTLVGTNVLVGTLTWSGGNLAGSLTVASNSVLNIVAGGGDGFNGLVLTNYGTVDWTNTQLYGINGQNAQIYNYGLWNAQSDNTFVGGNSGGTSLFDNFGTFLKSGNTGNTALDGSVVFNNTGTVTAQNGTLAIHGGGTGTGSTFATTGKGNISIYGYLYTNTTTFTGLGNFVAGGTATFGGAIIGTLNWDGGSLNGVMLLASNSVFNILAGGGDGLNGLVMTNYGTVNWANTQLYSLSANNAQIYNYGLWNAQSDNTFVGGLSVGTSLFDNFGTFLKSGNTGTTTLDASVVFNNTGTVTVQSGTLNIDLGSNNGGNFATTNSAALNLSSYIFTNTTTFTGSGNYVAGGATFAGNIVGMLNWDGGNLNGVMTLASNSVFNINFGGGNGFFYGLVLTNYGTVNWTNTQLYGRNNQNAQIYNYGWWNARSDNTFTGGNDGGTTLFDNFGTFLKSGNAGISTLDSSVAFTNTGTVSAQRGTVRLNGQYNLGSGTLNVGLNSLTNYGAISLAGAAPLSGTVSANLNNGFIPTSGNSFTILSYGSESGSFSSTELPPGFLWTTNYGLTGYTISVANALPQGLVTNLVTQWASGLAALRFNGSANASYTVLATTNLSAPRTNWIPLGQAVLQIGGSFQFLDDQSSSYSQRFYQIRSP